MKTEARTLALPATARQGLVSMFQEMPKTSVNGQKDQTCGDLIKIISVKYNCLTVSECKSCMVSVECIENHPTIQ